MAEAANPTVSIGSVDESKDDRCCTCNKLVIDYCFSNCKHLFCDVCYGKHYKQPCPVCGTIFETYTQDPDLLVHCEFQINGCEEMVKLKDFENHKKQCKFAKDKILPKLYKINPITEAIERLTGDVQRIDETLTMLKENVVMADIKIIKESQNTIFKQLVVNDRQIKDLQTESMRFKEVKDGDTLRKFNDEEYYNKEEMEEFRQNLSLLKKSVDSHDTALIKLRDDELRNTNDIKEIRRETLMQLREKLRKNEEKLKVLQENIDSQIKPKAFVFLIFVVAAAIIALAKLQLDDNMFRNEKANALMETAISELRNALIITKEDLQQVKQALQDEIKEVDSRQDITALSNTVAILVNHHNRVVEAHEELEKCVARLETKIITTYGNDFEKLQHLVADDYNGKLPAVFLWKIHGVQKMLKNIQEISFSHRSQKFFTTPNGLKFRPRIYTVQGSEYVRIVLEFTTNGDLSPNLHSRRYVLIDQSQGHVFKENVERIDRPDFNKTSAKDSMAAYFEEEWFFPIRLLRGKSKYVENDEILIEIILEPISILWKQTQSRDGVFQWRINDYSKKKRSEIKELKWRLTSDPFKTSDDGYTAHLGVHLNGYGDGLGKYVSITLWFILGEHDAFLPLPFDCVFDICIMDQSGSPAKENICETFRVYFQNGGYVGGTDTFALQSTVENEKYLQDDSIIILTSVRIVRDN